MSADTPAPFDEALVPFGELIAGFAPAEDEPATEADDLGRMRVERVSLDLPVELEVAVDEAGSLRLGTAPPTQHLKTSFMPVLHRMRLRIVRSSDHAE